MNSIASYQFLTIQGDPDHVKAQVEVIRRPGVDGVAIWKTGTRGSPFTIRTMVDTASLASALIGFNAYHALIGGAAVPLTWAGQFIGNVSVLDVRKVEIKAIGPSSGGINPPSAAKLVVDWDLVVVS